MKNMEIWNKLKQVPAAAQKKITGGRLKGMTDIKPQWRYMAMTEEFGVCGFGWYYDIMTKDIIEGANGEKAGFVDVQLFIKVGGEWSKPISGTGGSSFVANERNGAYTSDEVFKMALTDALSVAMAKIGVGASIYMGENDGAKYTAPKPSGTNQEKDDKPWLNIGTKEWNGGIEKGSSLDVMKKYFKVSKANADEYVKQLNANK